MIAVRPPLARILVLLATAAPLGCGGDGGGATADAGNTDVGNPDAGNTDAPDTLDAATDAGHEREDASSPTADASVSDAGADASEPTDASPPPLTCAACTLVQENLSFSRHIFSLVDG